MNGVSKNRKSLIIFFTVVTILSAIAELLICRYQNMMAYPLLMWMPAVSALAASIYLIRNSGKPFSIKELFRKMGFNFCNPLYIIEGILLPLIYLIIPYIVYWRMYPENYAYAGVPLKLVLSDCLPVAIIGIFMGLITATGEEIGWRGYLYPALKEEFGTEKALLMGGLYWCLWHFPLIIWGNYAEGVSLFYALIAFVLCIFPIGVICGILRERSGSMWPCAFLHAAHNDFDQTIFGVVTRGELKPYYAGETGIITIICVWIIAALMYIGYRKRSK